MATSAGLDGIVVADTSLSDVDGEAGKLVIAGHDVERLAGRAPFEEVCAMLWGARDVDARLGGARVAAFAGLERMGDALRARDGMDALRAGIAHLAPTGDEAEDAFAVTGAMAVVAAAWARVRAGKAPIAPDASRAHADDYGRMLRGEVDAAAARALDTYLVTVADHGMNASTFAARVVASTGSDLVSAVVAAIGALKGPLHGGAPGPVLDMLDAIGSADRATAWIEAELRAGRRIMGMGHRVYRVRDPRAAVFERAVEELARARAETAAGERLALARAVERAAEEALRARHPERPLKANVEFFTAVLLEAAGLPREGFTPTFAVGRVAGWAAHVMEQRRVGRLIRPGSRYVGARPVG